MEDSLLTGYNQKFRSNRFNDIGPEHRFQLSRRQVRRLECKIKIINNHIGLLIACSPALKAMGKSPRSIVQIFWRNLDAVERIVIGENPPTKGEFFEWYFNSDRLD